MSLSRTSTKSATFLFEDMAKYCECGICGTGTWCEPHHVFGGTSRKISEKYGAVVYLCRPCHDQFHRHPSAFLWLREKTQARVMFEQGWTLDDWMEHFNKNYL